MKCQICEQPISDEGNTEVYKVSHPKIGSVVCHLECDLTKDMELA